MENQKLINIQSASEITSGNKDLFCQMVDLFIQIAPTQLKRVKEAYTEKDWKKLVLYSHDLKCSASSFGAEKLYTSAFQLEQFAKKKIDINSISSHIEEVENFIQFTINYYVSLDWESDFKEEL